MDYMEEHYFKENHHRLWMKSYCQDIYYTSMDTNNYVESWHNQLKSNHLKHHYRARPDRILYILMEIVLETFKKDEFGALICVGRKMKGKILDILCQQDVQAMTEETIQKHCLFIEGRYIVESVTFPGRYYGVTQTNGLMNSCTCEYFLRHQRLCKHILMAIRKFPSILRLPFKNDFYISRTLIASSAALDLKQDIMQHETSEEEQEQNRMHVRAQALVESFSHYS